MALTLVAKNLTASDVVLVQLAVTVPGSGQAILTDANVWFEIRDDPQLELEILDNQLILSDGFNDYDKAGSLALLNPPIAGQLRSYPGAFTVPSSVAVGDIVCVTGANSADVADDSTITKLPAMGVVLQKLSTVTATLLYRGEAHIFSGLTPGARYFIATSGGLTLTPTDVVGKYIQSVGVAIDDNTLFFDPGMLIKL